MWLRKLGLPQTHIYRWAKPGGGALRALLHGWETVSLARELLPDVQDSSPIAATGIKEIGHTNRAGSQLAEGGAWAELHTVPIRPRE